MMSARDSPLLVWRRRTCCIVAALIVVGCSVLQQNCHD
jgi:hypothetical protein